MGKSSYTLDTHVWISIFHQNRNEKLVDAILEKGILLISNQEQENELLDAIHKHSEVQEMLPKPPEIYASMLNYSTQFFPSTKRFALLSDPKDNYLVDLAWQSQSTLVSDDSTFKFLNRLSRPKVNLISKMDFYKILGW